MKKVLTFIVLIHSFWIFCQKKDSINNLQEISVNFNFPVTQEKISLKEIQENNLGQDITYLLKNTISAISTSDSGTGIGYSSIRIRGTDATRINVTLNDVPINDAESQAVFWVNMPDLLSSTKNIIIQRGIGTSTNGTSTFGASILIKTKENQEDFNINLASSFGSFNTFKNSLRLSSGKISKYFYFDAGISFINSDGFIDRAFSHLFSYNYKISYKNKLNEISFFNFGGKEKTYQAWYGIDFETMQKNRKFNYAGAIYNQEGKIIDFYDNQTDNYKQNHYHLNWIKIFNEQIELKNTFYLTHGEGFYQEYKQNQNLNQYKINQNIESDLINHKWLKNNLYGIQSQLISKFKGLKNYTGINANQYLGNHFGKVIWIKNSFDFENNNYYENKSIKNEISGFTKFIFPIKKFNYFIDFQFRNVFYKAYEIPDGENFDLEGKIKINENFNFFNPKIGFSYQIKNGEIYFSLAQTNREPTRTDYLESNVKPKYEKLTNLELGFNKKFIKWNFETNFYYMNYKNQLILTGNLDEVGNSIRENTPKSYRLGIEYSMDYKLNSRINLFGNFNLSSNKIILDNEIKHISYSPNFISNFGFDVKFYKENIIKLTNQYVSSQFLTNSNLSNSQLLDYFITDLTILVNSILKNDKCNFNFSIKNLFGKEYSNNGYFHEQIYYYPQAKLFFFMGFSLNL